MGFLISINGNKVKKQLMRILQIFEGVVGRLKCRYNIGDVGKVVRKDIIFLIVKNECIYGDLTEINEATYKG